MKLLNLLILLGCLYAVNARISERESNYLRENSAHEIYDNLPFGSKNIPRQNGNTNNSKMLSYSKNHGTYGHKNYQQKG